MRCNFSAAPATLLSAEQLFLVVQAFDDTHCGFAYSTADQVAYCPVEQPPTWPALLQLPEDQYTGLPNSSPDAADANGLNVSSASLLYTGQDRATADALMNALFARNQTLGEIH